MLAAGCGAGGPSGAATATPSPRADTAPRALAPPVLCGPLAVRTVGTVADPRASEVSGLVRSTRTPGLLWAANDSGDAPRLLGLRGDGAVVGDVAVTGAQNVDWEDLAAGPGGDLYAADIGDNDGVRASIQVYRVPEPDPAAPASAPARRYELRYPDRPHDAETLLVDRRTGDLVVITKTLGGGSDVFFARHPSSRRPTTLRRVGALQLGLGGLATGGDVSADGRVVVVRTYTGIVAWARRPGERLSTALRRAPCSGEVDLADEGQGEAIALSPSGRSFVTVPEGSGVRLRRYAPAG